jgi:hypothetical protein
LETARQTAIAQNAHVWLALGEDVSVPASPRLVAAVIVSRDGSDVSGWVAGQTVDLRDGPVSGVQLAGKVETVMDVALLPKEEGWTPQMLVRPGFVADAVQIQDLAHDAPVFLVRNPSGGAAWRLDRVVRFSPSGEARSGASLAQVIEFALQPVRGEAVAANRAVFQISQMTGTYQVFRP